MILRTPEITGKENVTGTKRTVAVSAVLGMIIGIGITAAVGGGVYYIFQEQADLFSSSSQIEIRNLNAVLVEDHAGTDTLRVTANIKNVGSTSIGSIEINNISAGRLTITDVEECKHGGDNPTVGNCIEIHIGGGKGAGNGAGTGNSTDNKVYISSRNQGAAAGDKADLGSKAGASESTANITGKKGFNLPGGAKVPINGGGSKAFQMIVEGDMIAESISVSDRLTFQLKFESASDEYVSDIYNTRVRPG